MGQPCDRSVESHNFRAPPVRYNPGKGSGAHLPSLRGPAEGWNIDGKSSVGNNLFPDPEILCFLPYLYLYPYL